MMESYGPWVKPGRRALAARAARPTSCQQRRREFAWRVPLWGPARPVADSVPPGPRPLAAGEAAADTGEQW